MYVVCAYSFSHAMAKVARRRQRHTYFINRFVKRPNADKNHYVTYLTAFFELTTRNSGSSRRLKYEPFASVVLLSDCSHACVKLTFGDNTITHFAFLKTSYIKEDFVIKNIYSHNLSTYSNHYHAFTCYETLPFKGSLDFILVPLLTAQAIPFLSSLPSLLICRSRSSPIFIKSLATASNTSAPSASGLLTGVGLAGGIGDAFIDMALPLRLYLGGATGGFSLFSPHVLNKGLGVVGDSGGVL